MKVWSWVLLLLLLFSSNLAAAPNVGSVSKNADPVGQYKKFELSFPVTTWASNLYDPAQIDVHVTFTSPGGQSFVINAFPYQAYTRSGSRSGQTLNPTGALEWRCRFAPTSIGNWTYSLTTIDTGGTAAAITGTFNVTASSSHGFVRVSPNDNRYFNYSDGTAVFPVGENFAWADSKDHNTYFYDDHLAKLNANGANLVRLWMASWSFGVEHSDTGLGDYSRRQDRAWALDYVLDQLDQRGMMAELCLENHIPFSASNGWGDSPYNISKGGPLSSPEQLWTNATAQSYFSRRYRYITARWGYSTAVMAYEFWNEIENTDNYAGQWSNIANWHATNAAVIRAASPQQHPLSTSFGYYIQGQERVWPHLDFTQFHQYNAQDMAGMMRDRVPQMRGYKQGPTFAGEFGTDWDWSNASLLTNDVPGWNLHSGNWGSLMTGAGAGALTWWWDNLVDGQNQYQRYKGIAGFVAGEDLDRHQYAPQAPAPQNTGGAPLRSFVLKGSRRVLGWVQNSNAEWYARRQNWGINTSTGVWLTINGLGSNGAWTVQWWDTVTGTLAQTQNVTVSGGNAVLYVPQLDSGHPDWAFKLFPANTTPTVTPTPIVNAIPGRVQAEDYSGFYDTSVGNQFGQYRSNDVDIEASTDSGGGYSLGAIEAGEWLDYQVQVASAGTYSASFRVASQNAGPFSLTLALDGAPLGGTVSFNGTGGWQTWATVTVNGLNLPAGRHTLRLIAGAAHFNVNWMEFAAQAAPTATATVTWTPSPLPTATTVAGSTCKVLLAYYPYWNSNYRAAQIPFNKVTHINHAFAAPQSNGTVTAPNGYLEPALISGAHAAGVKVLASIGGADSASTAAFRSIAASASLRTAFANNLEAFCRNNGYDGVDIDWEFPSSSSDRANMTAMIAAIRAKFNASAAPAPQYLISMAVPPLDYTGQFIDYGALSTSVNYFNIMGYDSYGAWSSYVGHNAALTRGSDPGDLSDKAAIDYMLNTRGIAPGKVLLGLPFYGYQWSTASALYQNCAGCPSAQVAYKDIAPLVGSGWNRIWDAGSQVPYLLKNPGPGFYSYDDPQSIALKTQYAATRGIAGTFMWDLSQDRIGNSQPLLDAMVQNQVCGTPAPTATPIVQAVPGRVEAENYSAYFDTTAGNQFGQYRGNDVDIEACSDAGGGFSIGAVDNGEWLEYQVQVATTGVYTASFRVASLGTGPFSAQLQLDGANLGSALSFNGTGGWQTWANAAVSGLSLSAGRHTLRVQMPTGLFNLNYVDFALSVPPTATATVTSTSTATKTATASSTATFTPTWTTTSTTQATVFPTADPTAASTSVPTVLPPTPPTLPPTAVPTLVPTAIPTKVPTPRPTATTPPSSSLRIIQALPVPNPNPTIFYVQLSNWADQIELNIYSPGNAQVARQVTGPHYIGWTLVYLPASMNQVANGNYYYTMVARSSNGGQSAQVSGVLAIYR